MSDTERRIDDWERLDLFDLVFAYRKAKVDCFYERSQCDAEHFVAFEKNLYARLSDLLDALRGGRVGELLHSNLGTLVSIPKKLSLKPRSAPNQPGKDPSSTAHGFFSSPERAFRQLQCTHELTPEYRLIGEFPVVLHVMSALWINLVGHHFDARLGPEIFGARLRRYRSRNHLAPKSPGRYHLEGIGSFQPYFRPYRAWRSEGIAAARNALKQEKPVIAMSLDISNYYHRLLPSFLASPLFHQYIGVELSEFEAGFTAALCEALSAWDERCRTELAAYDCKVDSSDPNDMVVGGIPIGLACTRLIANIYLAALDRQLISGLSPLFYGRYVDDMFLVLGDTGFAEDSDALFRHIESRLPCITHDGKRLRIDFTTVYGETSRLSLQTSKQKVFFLDGRTGIDLLGSIEQEIARVASERRLLPDPEDLEGSAAARVLTAAGTASNEADSFRRADGLSVRRLGWSIQLRNVETLARDLRKDEWTKERERFYLFARDHIIRPDRLLDHIDYLPRLLSLAVSLGDWEEATALYETAEASIRELAFQTKYLCINGYEAQDDMFGTHGSRTEKRLKQVCADAVLRALRYKGGSAPDLGTLAKRLAELLELPTDVATLTTRVLDLREADWAKTPYKSHLRRDATHPRKQQADEDLLLRVFSARDHIEEFLKAAGVAENADRSHRRVSAPAFEHIARESRIPYLFPTRPYTAQEIALHVPRCIVGPAIEATRLWARCVHGVRGAWVQPRFPEFRSSSDPGGPSIVYVACRPPEAIRLGITSLHTSEQSWAAAANDTPDVGLERYGRIKELVNAAIRARPPITHLLLPESALPERWLPSISNRLRDAKISLIAGLDYHHVSGTVHSEAALVLTDDRLGFPSTVEIRQPKTVPAVREDEELTRRFGKRWQSIPGAKNVYSHGGFDFGVLVCSELQNIAHRSMFQGQVDCLMVLSWNRDLETFSALVESAALDVHSYVALVNNRQYGDSRVRSPAKQAFRRDLCRIQGGENEYLVVVELNHLQLRAFQSRAKPWPTDKDAFKPVPEGFVIAARRRVTPR